MESAKVITITLKIQNRTQQDSNHVTKRVSTSTSTAVRFPERWDYE